MFMLPDDIESSRISVEREDDGTIVVTFEHSIGEGY